MSPVAALKHHRDQGVTGNISKGSFNLNLDAREQEEVGETWSRACLWAFIRAWGPLPARQPECCCPGLSFQGTLLDLNKQYYLLKKIKSLYCRFRVGT